MKGATRPVGGPLYPVDSRFPTQAKKRLIATHPNSKFGLTNCNQRRLTISNRNRNRLSCFQILSVSPHPEWNRRARLFTLSGCEGRGQSAPVWEDGSSIRPQASSPQNLIANLKLESPVTRSKQSLAPHSNREKFRSVDALFSTSYRSSGASRLSWAAEVFSHSLRSDFLHSHRDACNISPSKSRSGAYLVERIEHVISQRHALHIPGDISNPNQRARSRRVKK
jgi:hypothetical protein